MSWPCHSLSCYRTSVLPWMSERHWKLHCQPWTPTMPVSLKHFLHGDLFSWEKGIVTSDPVPKINTASLVRGCKVATFSVHKVIENTVLHYRWKKNPPFCCLPQLNVDTARPMPILSLSPTITQLHAILGEPSHSQFRNLTVLIVGLMVLLHGGRNTVLTAALPHPYCSLIQLTAIWLVMNADDSYSLPPKFQRFCFSRLTSLVCRQPFSCDI